MNKKIREAQLDQVNYILVVGDKEMDANSVNVRTRDNDVKGEVKIDDLITQMQEEIYQKA
jgi:threonyl-tRNA synthetase